MLIEVIKDDCKQAEDRTDGSTNHVIEIFFLLFTI